MGVVRRSTPHGGARAPVGTIDPLTSSLSNATVDGTLEDVSGIGSVSEAAVERNFSELNAKINEILAALRTYGVIE